MYCESQEKAQSHIHLSVFFLRVFLKLKSAVDQILHVPSAEAVARRLLFVCVEGVLYDICSCPLGVAIDTLSQG